MTALLKTAGNHLRVPWRHTAPNTIMVHVSFDKLKGTFRTRGSDAARGVEKYNKAKTGGDLDAASELVEGLIDGKIIDKLIDAIIEPVAQ